MSESSGSDGSQRTTKVVHDPSIGIDNDLAEHFASQQRSRPTDEEHERIVADAARRRRRLDIVAPMIGRAIAADTQTVVVFDPDDVITEITTRDDIWERFVKNEQYKLLDRQGIGWVDVDSALLHGRFGSDFRLPTQVDTVVPNEIL